MSWISGLFGRAKRENQLGEEVRSHLEMAAQERVGRGETAKEAERAVRREFGNVGIVQEATRDVWGWRWLRDAADDARYGLRMLRKNPGFTAVAVVTIALGIAANVTVFSFLDALFLRSVPAKDPGRLVRILAPENDGGGLFSYPEYEYLRDHAKAVEELTAHYSTAPLFIRANSETGEVQGAAVSSSYFPLLGVRPYIGRFFTSEQDSVPDRDAVAVLGYGFWQRIYGGDPQILGKTLLINGHAFGITGVMPPDFHGVEIGGMPNEIWIPAKMIRVGYRGCDGFEPSCTVLNLIGRLKPDKNIAEAQTELAVLMRQLQTTATGYDERLGVSVTPAIGISGGREYFLLLSRLLTTTGGLFFLIVCANLAGLLVARGTARRAEIAMRQALGAGRLRIMRQLLTESLLLACAGAGLGAVISIWTSRLLVGFYTVDDEGYRHLFDLRADSEVVLYSVAMTAVAGLLFGLLPALQASRTDLNQVFKSGGSSAGPGRRISRMALVAVQMALSLALLVGAGLLARSASRIEAGTNMDVHHVLGLRLRPELLRYTPTKAHAFKRDVVRRLRELPGVESVSLAKGQGLVWHAMLKAKLTLPGKAYPKPEDELVILHQQIAPDYFATLKIPLLSGRDFNEADRPGSPLVAIVNETLAGQITPSERALGRTILLDKRPYQIVGVVKDAQFRNAIEGPVAVAYQPFWQDETLIDARMCVRVSGNPAAALPMIRKTIATIDPNVPITESMPLIDQVRGAFTDARVASAVLNCAAGLGLLLSCIGLYGVLAYEVNRRTKEIGIRMALGAEPTSVIRLFLRQGLAMLLAGFLAGGALALATTKLLGAWLVGVHPKDPASFGVAAGIMLGITLLACYLPARRATRVDPMVALRYE